MATNKFNYNQMRSRFLLFGMVVVIFTLLSFGFNAFTPNNKPINLDKGNDYKSAWISVDSLVQKGLPKSALEVVNKIYDESKTDNNYNQLIKSFIYKLKLKENTEEDAFESSIYQLQNEIKIAQYPSKNIMHSMLAEMYWMYYQNNRYKFINRSETQNFENNDIKTWDLNKLSDVIIKEYLLSLEQEDSLKRTSVSYFETILYKGENTENMRPTLYDFLAHRAIKFFQNKEITLSRPADKFQLLEDYYFANASDFASTEIKTQDTLSLQFYGIKILQNLVKFRMQDKNIPAFIDVDLKRLEFVYSNSVNPNKEELYRNALSDLLKTYSNKPASAYVAYVLGQNFVSLGNKYVATDSLTFKYKSYKKKGHDIFAIAIKNHPKSKGAQFCKNAQESLKRKELSFVTEEVVPSNSVFAMQIKYKNTDTVFYKIGRIDFKEYKKITSKKYGNDLFEDIYKSVKFVKSSEIILPNDNDFNSHATEFLLDGLDLGFYVIFASNNKSFKIDSNIITYASINISNLSYTNRSDNGYFELYVLNRKTGEPVANVEVQTYYQKYNYTSRRYEKKKNKLYHSDTNGYVKVSGSIKNHYDNYIDLRKGDDFLSSDNSFYMYSYKDNSKPEVRTTVFTDRAIYRPGQTVYFKGIVIEYFKDERKIVTNHKQTVLLYDVNYQKIAELQVSSNEFGTFNGSFVLPTGTLNGQFQISTKNGSKYFSVEEYKRPKFEAKILPFESNYRLNDKVEIKGKAIAYSGANITDANVVYRITRQPVWRYWWWNRPTSFVEIANGTVTTDDKGEYYIKFKALPDLEYKKSNDISFTYSISVDITDINGETQSTSSSIRIGYVDLSLSTSLANKNLEINQKDSFNIYANNLNGEKVNTKGKISIYKLKSPKTADRPRYWNQPDKFLYSEKEWNEKFPKNVYKDKMVQNYEVEKTVMSFDFDTEKETKFILNTLNKWDLGYYKLVIDGKDAYGSKISNIQTFTVYSAKSKKLSSPNVLAIEPIKVNCEPGEDAKLLIGSSENIKLIYEIEFKGKIIKSEILSLNNAQKTIIIPVKEEYRGNFAVHFTSVFNNRFHTISQQITVPYSTKELDIEFQTFRNKLLPGEKEKWLMTVKGSNGDKVMSELMLTAYDKSLDQFAKNYWGLDIWNYRSYSKYWSSGMFGTNNARLVYNNNNYKYIPVPNIRYDAFNWFGFSYYSGYYDYLALDECKSVAPMSMAGGVKKRSNNNGKYEETVTAVSEEASEYEETDG